MIRTAIFAALTGLFALTFTSNAEAQKYFTRDGKVTFDATAKASPEDIKATSNNGTLVLDKSTGDVQMAVLLKGFIFKSALMQEHFNENYLETQKFPKSEFKGKLDNPGALDFSKDGTYNAKVNGTLTMHGVTQNVSAPVTFTVKGGKITANCKFSVSMADYKVEIPSLVADKVNKQAAITVQANLAPLNK